MNASWRSRALVLLTLLSGAPAFANNVVGAWSAPTPDNWPLIPIHAVLLPDGRVLTYGTYSIINGTPNPAQQTGSFKYDIWNPTLGFATNAHFTLDNITLTDIFCGSQVVLPASGSVFLAGGDNWTGTATTNTGNNNSNVFRYTDNTLSRGSNMNRARWYSSSTTLTNGETYIQGGNGGGDRPEVRDINGAFRLLSNVDTSALAPTFPRNFVAPDGRIFGFDSGGVMYYVNPSGSGVYSGAGTFSSSYAGSQSSAAMFRPGRILQLGANSSGAATIDINGPAPIVTATQSMASVRKWVSATVLADGRVLATGGSPVDNDATNANYTAVVWDPTLGTNGQWVVGPPAPPNGSRYRLYHSGALLLPDASVLVMGGGAPGPAANLHGEIYYPSYLYNSSGVFATRPTIVSAPDTLDQGVDFSMNIGTADIRRLTLVKTGSTTHSVNMDQRFIELPFSASSGTLFVEMPDSVTTVPPGYYLLFAINASGVPSVGKIVRVNIPSNPVIQLDYTATVGGTAGTAFALACNWNEAVVGIFGNATTSVNRLGVQCVQVNQAGHWIGAPVNRGATGTATGAAFTKTCAQDSAISGFRGRSSTLVDQLDFACKPLTFSGKVSGTIAYLGAVGGTGGTVQGPFDCSTNNPVYSLSGRSGANINAFSMLCRQVPITYVAGNSPPIVINPGSQSGTTGTPVSLQISASDPNSNPLTYSATGLPTGLTIGTTTGLITGIPTVSGTYPVVVSVSDGTDVTTVNFTWTIGSPNPLILNPMPDQPAQLVNTQVTYTATTQSAINPRYKWYFDDGTETGYSSSPSVTHTFTQPTIYWVAVTATDDRGVEQTQTFSQIIYRPLTASRPSISSTLALGGGRLWVVNQDNDTVSAFNTTNNQKLAEIAVGASPRAVAIAPSGEVWVTNKAASTISVIDPTTMTVNRTITLSYGTQPFGIAFAPNGSAAFVALEGAGRVVRLDPVSGSELVGVNVGPNPRHVSVSADSGKVYISRFITPPLPGESTAVVSTQSGGVNVGGEVLVFNAANLTAISTIELRHSDDLDFENSGAGIPNYLGPVVISNDGVKAWVPSKKDNVKRGTLRSGANLNFQNTVRAISSSIDLATNQEDFGSRIDHDNASLASTAAFDKYGVFMFVALETSREVAVVDAHNHAEFFRINVGRAPQGLAVSADGYRLYVSNFMDRTVGVYDLTQLVDKGQWQAPLLATLQPVATERLTPTVLLGKQLFYDARDTRLALDRYMSCASCHNDGGGDGRVWDLTGLGEGLRSTLSLRGKSGMGHGFLHWTANFDEIQDFEGQIRTLAGGTGLMSDAQFNTGTRNQPLGDPKAGVSSDLDALAAYVSSLTTFPKSPFRNPDGSLTAAGVAGQAVFQNLNCAQCHSGAKFSDSGAAILHDVGTIKQPTSGKRLGATLTGLDTPTLRDVWATAPYLHDGSAATLEDAVRAHSGVTVSDSDLANLVAYLKQLDTVPPSATGLVAAYGFEEGGGATVLDGSGNGNTGAVAGGAVWTQGRNGGALMFDGVNDRVAIASSPSLNLTTAVTLEAWVYPTVFQGDWRTIIQKENDAYYLHASNTTGSMKPAAGGWLNGASALYITAPSPLPVNAWSHLAMTYDGANRRLYVNGVQVATDARTGLIQVTSNPLSIGGTAVYGEYFQGRIDDVRVYSRALTAGEINTDMATAVGTPAPDSTPPTATITGPVNADTYSTSSVTLNLSGTAADNVGVTQVTWTNDRGGSGTTTGTTAWSVNGITLQSGTNVLTVTARDAANNSATDVLTVTYTPVVDVTPPTATITGPTNADTLATSSATLNVSGTAADNVGVTQVTWTNDRGGSGTASGTTSWSVNGIALQSGVNVLTVTARDAANNPGTDVLTVTYTPADTTPPTVSITGPTNADTFATSTATLNLSGTAADDVGVTQVTWTNDRGGSGTATGSTSWSVNGITLQSGTNVLTVTARDAANNPATDVLTVTYTPTDSTPPTATITGPVNADTYSTSSVTLNLSGTAADNVGVTQVTWTNDRGGSGTATGTTAWSVNGITLQSGTNVLTVTARDAANNSATDVLTVTYTPVVDVTPPTATITGPTNADTLATSSATLNVSGTAADNVGVTQVTWTNDRGGSGTASGTTSWSVNGIALQSGVNVLTVTARDAANNPGTDVLTVTYTPGSVPGLVASYGFEEGGGATVLDGSGNGNTGAVSGGAVWTTQGRNGGALIFDGVNDRVAIASSPSLNVTTGMTLEAWVFPAAFQADWRTIIQKESNAYYLHASNTTGALKPAGGGVIGGGSSTYITSPTQLPLAWSHLALTYDGATRRLYVNGVQVASDARSGAIQTTSNPLSIGGQSVDGEYFNGRIDDVRVYSRALSVTEIQNDMATPVGTPTPDTTPPTVSITGPTNAATFATSTATLNLSGTAADNVGVTQVTWTNDRGGSGTTTGTTAWSVNGITLQSGTNVLTVTARDAANNSATDVLTVTYTPVVDVTPPTATITGPTNADTLATSSATLNVSGTAADNVGVTQVTWTNDRGGSGTASGTTSWSVNGIALQSGVNVLTVTARDAANNPGTDVLTVTYTPGSVPGLVASYGFEEGGGATVLDGSGNGNTGAVAGGAVWTQGRNGGALMFDGVNDRVAIASSPSLNLTTAVTLEAWVYPTVFQGDWRTIIQKENDAYYLHASNTTGSMKPAAGGWLNGASALYITAPSPLPVNAWSHLAMTYDGANRRLYVNGVQVATDARTGLIQVTSNPLSIGGTAVYGDYFQGRIDDVRVYSRALTAGEINTDMATPAP